MNELPQPTPEQRKRAMRIYHSKTREQRIAEADAVLQAHRQSDPERYPGGRKSWTRLEQELAANAAWVRTPEAEAVSRDILRRLDEGTYRF